MKVIYCKNKPFQDQAGQESRWTAKQRFDFHLLSAKSINRKRKENLQKISSFIQSLNLGFDSFEVKNPETKMASFKIPKCRCNQNQRGLSGQKIKLKKTSLYKQDVQSKVRTSTKPRKRLPITTPKTHTNKFDNFFSTVDSSIQYFGTQIQFSQNSSVTKLSSPQTISLQSSIQQDKHLNFQDTFQNIYLQID